MKKLAIMMVLVLSLTGCQALSSGFVEGAEEKIRLKWAEEWRPALEAEMNNAVDDAKDAVLDQVMAKLEGQEKHIEARLASVDIRFEDFDENKDGNVTGLETAKMWAAMQDTTDKDGKPLGWLEMLMAVVLGYGTTTGAKEWMKSKIANGNGASHA